MVCKSIKYVQEAFRICKEYVAKHRNTDYILPKTADNPFSIGYCIALDVSPELGADLASY